MNLGNHIRIKSIEGAFFLEMSFFTLAVLLLFIVMLRCCGFLISQRQALLAEIRLCQAAEYTEGNIFNDLSYKALNLRLSEFNGRKTIECPTKDGGVKLKYYRKDGKLMRSRRFSGRDNVNSYTLPDVTTKTVDFEEESPGVIRIKVDYCDKKSGKRKEHVKKFNLWSLRNKILDQSY